MVEGSILELEKIIIETIDDVFIDLPTRNFAEFMIILARRKTGENKIRVLFEEYDSDGSGSVQKEEIKKWLDQHGKPVSKAQAGKISDAMDVSGDDRISYEEFLTMIAARLLVLNLQ
ncbi:Oidioi.mRNA.OKI2018_I69.chr1.g3713.t1.cds [Oikopleura dioica]|uniref:Oidioi.mRNA.OKI2018_I69.chr1.g3713.t1.cds n=1 Tax=Oikopleura dioica TaxID=34765 RepID=A0ABN7SWS0_OIKDI|nr:Oidioi.mRNA.OKI2018_I69.chr1.g3713.t1.cds [Oikopleura dioica]